MANPQKENGFTSIANDLLEHLAKNQIAGNLWRLLITVIRQTYGWGRKVDRISVTQFEQKTGLKRWHVVRGLNALSLMNMITAEKKSARQIYYGFQKDFDQWKIPDRYQNRKQSLSLPKLVIPITKTGNDVVTKTGKHKRKKETNTKEKVRNLSSKETLEVYLLSLSEYQNTPSHLKEPIALFVNKCRQANKTRTLAPSRVNGILQSFKQIIDKYGANNTLAGIDAVFTKERRDGFSYVQYNPTGYIRTVAKSIYIQSAQIAAERQAQTERDALKQTVESGLMNTITEALRGAKSYEAKNLH